MKKQEDDENIIPEQEVHSEGEHDRDIIPEKITSVDNYTFWCIVITIAVLLGYLAQMGYEKLIS